MFPRIRPAQAILMLLLPVLSCSRKDPYNVPNCSRMWNGEFYASSDGAVALRISRHGDRQTERFITGEEGTFRVEWVDSCRYRLFYLSGNLPDRSDAPVVVQITGVKKNSYTMEAWQEGTALRTHSYEIFREK